MVDCNRPVTGHDSKQLRLLGSLSATYAGANRSGHRNRLTWARTDYSITDGSGRGAANGSVAASLWMSQVGWRMLGRLKLATFAISRRQVPAGREMLPPLRFEGPTDPHGSGVQQRRLSHALEGP
jgi:hypothetical protein